MIDILSISTELELANNGIWYSKESQTLSYPTDGNESCFTVEDNSFWFKHRNNCIISIIKSHPPKDNETIFDIGGGNGFVSKGIANADFNVVLVEPGSSGAINAKNRGLKNVICATTDTARFKPHSLPAVGLFDVVEHIEDDLAFLKSIRGLIKKGGYLYMTVPAYSFLWSTEDVIAGHYRRYTLGSICSILESAGFTIEYPTYIFRFLPIPTFLIRALPYKLGLTKITTPKEKDISRDHIVKNGIMSRTLNFLLQTETKKLSKKHPMSFGGSCLIVAKSP
ncbi:MAG: methyltransferase domain-containing protein [Methyloprofundus sp.]|nr:methyltransferase domain-containing protein [Methyloprofundus sp.]